MEEKDPIDTTIIEGLIAEIGPESMARVLDAMASDAERLHYRDPSREVILDQRGSAPGTLLADRPRSFKPLLSSIP